MFIKKKDCFSSSFEPFKSFVFKKLSFFVSLNGQFRSSIVFYLSNTLFHKKIGSFKKTMPISYPRSIEVYNGTSWVMSDDSLAKYFIDGVGVEAKCPA